MLSSNPKPVIFFLRTGDNKSILIQMPTLIHWYFPQACWIESVFGPLWSECVLIGEQFAMAVGLEWLSPHHIFAILPWTKA